MRDWQLPVGVTRALWDSFHNPDLARQYDALLEGTPLLRHDLAFFDEHCPRPGKTLDLGAGTGRLSIPLAERTYQPVAVDLSREMLNLLRSKAERAGVVVPSVCANIADLRMFADQSFDYVACLFSTLGLVVGASARKQVFDHAFRVLKPGGVFVFHVHNRWFNAWTTHGRNILWQEWFGAWTGKNAPGDYEMPAHHGAGRWTMHLFTRGEIRAMVRSAGFYLRELKPIAASETGELPMPWLVPPFRCYGYLVAAIKEQPMAEKP